MQLLETNFNGRTIKYYSRNEADNSVAAEIFKLREYRCAEEAIKQAKEAIVDVGAHIGLFSLYCRALNPAAKIFALEPSPDNFTLLKKNLRLNGDSSTQVFKEALFNSGETVDLTVSSDGHNNSLLPRDNFPGDTRQIIKVKAVSLADFCAREKINAVDLLKLDIEGAEFAVINGLTKKDFAKIKYMVMEYHNYNGQNHKDLENILRENGFSARIFPSQFDKKLGFIFARNKKV